jgi:DNA sulfur modification protein DndC
MEILKEACGGEALSFELMRELLDVERRYRTAAKRANLFDKLEAAFRRSFYEDAEDATERARRRKTFDEKLSGLRQGELDYREVAEAVERRDAREPT